LEINRASGNNLLVSYFISSCGRVASGQSMWKNLPRGLSVRS
jgi:hypothetical protein